MNQVSRTPVLCKFRERRFSKYRFHNLANSANASLKEEATSFTNRMTRNLQHLLKMESYLHRVIDPGAGSYYIEQLTEKLAEKAWTRFQELEKEGAFS